MTNANGAVLQHILAYDANYSMIGEVPVSLLRKTDNMLSDGITVYHSGVSSTMILGNNTRVTMGNFYNVGDLQSDGSSVQVGCF